MSRRLAPTFSLTDPSCEHIFKMLFRTDKAKRAATRGWQEGPVHIFGGIMSSDPVHLQFMDKLTRLLNDNVDVNVDDLGRVYGTGVRSSWYGARHVPGYPAKRGTWPLYDNHKKRADQGLKDSFQQSWHKNLYEAWIRLAFADLAPQPMRIRKGASTCCPMFVTGPNRVPLAIQAFNDAQAAGKLFKQGKYLEAFGRYAIGGAYYVVYRRQSSDKISFEDGEWRSKDRWVADLLYAISGGAQGEQVIADKTFGDELQTPKGFFRQRLRTATAIPGSLGAALTPIAQSVRTRIYEKFGFTYHHTTRLQKEEKLRKFAMTIAADVSDHDINWPLWIIDEVAVPTLLDMGFADWWVELFATSFKLPVYASCPAEGEGQLLIGDIAKPDGNLGLCSGNPFTDLVGSWNMTVVYAMIQIEHTARHHIKSLGTVAGAMRWLESYMKGELDIAVMDKSDDALLLWRDDANLNLASKLHQAMKNDESVNDYMTVGYEHGGAFLGDVLLYGPSRELRGVTLIGNIVSLVVNMFCPEYAAAERRDRSYAGYMDRQRSKRPYPGLAYQALADVYGSSPCYTQVMELIEQAWRDTHGRFAGRGTFRAFRERMLAEDKELLRYDMLRRELPDINVAELSSIDIEVLTKGEDRLHWKYLPSDVSPELSVLLGTSVPLEEVSTYFSSIVNP